jgi:Family of unknown function (DUF6529)
MAVGAGRVTDGSARRLLVPALVGGAVAVGLGVYSRSHTASGEPLFTLGFSSLLSMKAWLTTAVVVLAVVQLATALRMYGRLGAGPVAAWTPRVHRWSGRLAFLLSIPVAYHCLWALGYQNYDTRVLVHSLVGCFFYGIFVAKMLALRMQRLPGWTLPVAGGLTFTALVAIWWTSSLWFFTTVGFPAW